MKILVNRTHSRTRWLAKPLGSAEYKHWLLDTGSLTKRLQSSSLYFAVQPLLVKHQTPLHDELHILAMRRGQIALIREVQLLCAAKPTVFAHSVLPHASLRGRWHGLGRIGNRSLGSTLFADAHVSRTPLEYKKLAKHHALYRKAAAGLEDMPANLWARRSVFRLQHAAILVTEVFLPEVLKLNVSNGTDGNEYPIL